MIVINVNYLTGCVVATDRTNRRGVEWPPHPQRLFSALVAAWKECDLGEGVERALEWLESLPAPQLRVSTAVVRTPISAYVPVNDSSAPDVVPRRGFSRNQLESGQEVLPQFRSRQERFFPIAVPDDPQVSFIWSADDDTASVHLQFLQRAAAQVTYLGHSSSLVRVTATTADITGDIRPARDDEPATWMLRVPSPGRLQTLCQRFTLSHEIGKRMEPPDGRFVGYVAGNDRLRTTPQTVFGGERDWFVFQKTSGSELPITASLKLSSTVRKAMMDLAKTPFPILCGHERNGSPLSCPHVAIVPLAFVDHQYADGSLKGFAVVLPRQHTPQERRQILGALGQLCEVSDGRTFRWFVKHWTPGEPPWSLDPHPYLGASPLWATVTPMVFGHFPRGTTSQKTFRIVADACKQIGLPSPKAIFVSKVSKIRGTRPSDDFPSLTTSGKPAWRREDVPVRYRAHIALEFAERVRGPVIVGAGRYFGMGLCKPLRDVDHKGQNDDRL